MEVRVFSSKIDWWRLHINAGGALGPFISLADKHGFLTELAQRAPHLRREGDRLVPASGDA